ncbi:MAG: ZIP family metal transporter [Anaerolineaceae bacterium]|nr:ZIP family metal transporter [Anaerolineaceae bacterium]MDD4042864.1 ZIP family metal transporter [Anaerolineaceae bacterium]MDD4577641.1 ZIP family metal transporter [Anaerolineaceae bacterium]
MFENLHPLVNILLLSLMASLGTGLGGLIASIRRPGRRSYGFLMGITAGVMICLAFLELVQQSIELSNWLTATIGFGLGAIFMFLLDNFIPHIRFDEREIPKEQVEFDDCVCDGKGEGQGKRRRQRRKFLNKAADDVDRSLVNTGLLLAIGITIHNLPEGIAVGAGYLHNPQFGVFIAVAILLHNIPEGIATALPLCKAGICKRDAVKVAFLSGLGEPVGALLASVFLVRFTALLPGALAFAGGVMVFITLDELIPTARKYGSENYTALGIITGSMFVFILTGVFGI